MARLFGSKDKKKRKRFKPLEELKTGRLCGVKCHVEHEKEIKEYCEKENWTISEFFVYTGLRYIREDKQRDIVA